MSKYSLCVSARTACLLSVVVACFAVSSPLAADDQTQPAPGGAEVKSQPGHVTRTITINTPSVTVRANPNKPQVTPAQASTPRAGGQYVHLDANGQPLSSPPPGILAPIPQPPSGDPVPFRTQADPNARLFDSSHIRAVVVGRVNANGQVELDCHDGDGAAVSGHHDHLHDAASPAAKVSSNKSIKEVR